MAAELAAALDARLAAGFRFFRRAEGKIHEGLLARELRSAVEDFGPYLLCRAPGFLTLWGSFLDSLGRRKPLVLLPPTQKAEEEILLRQLPLAPPGEAVLALFTSGSSGTPKAVLHGESSLLASARQLWRAYPESRTGSLLPCWGMAGMAFHLLHPLGKGGEHFFSEESLLYWSQELDPSLRSLEIERLSLNPYLLEMWRRSDELRWDGGLTCLTAPLKAPLREEFSRASLARLEEVYGMTEAAGPVLREGILLGAQGRLSPEGELLLSGSQLCLGYGQEGKFEERLSWFPTGDAFRLEGERFHFVARRKELINVGGRKIAPALVEEVFEAMEEIRECVAFEKEVQGSSRVAFVFERSKECALREEELAEKIALRARVSLSLDTRPAWWREVERLARLPNGKPDRKKIKSEWT